MKTLLLGFALLIAGLFFSGCESISARMAERFDTVSPQTREYMADQKALFQAVQKALKRMDFAVTRSALAQGIVEAKSSIRDTASFGAGRQFIFEIRLHGADAQSTHVDVRLTELLEGDFKVGATGKTLRVHGLYDSFFAQVDQALRGT
jgi:outer membrane murein-binding lipoprotein Lpp